MPDEPPAAEVAAAFACSSWPLSSLTRLSRFRNLSMTRAAAGSASCDGCAFDAPWLATRSRRRAHLGGRSVDGKTQAIFARRQLEHGDSLSQRTFRERHLTQLRSFGAGAGAGADELLPPDAGDVAFFSEAKAEAQAEAPALTGGTCAMVASDNRHCSLCMGPTRGCALLSLLAALPVFHRGRCPGSLVDDSRTRGSRLFVWHGLPGGGAPFQPSTVRLRSRGNSAPSHWLRETARRLSGKATHGQLAAHRHRGRGIAHWLGT
jgi:hypothetical protein